jgi:hypothetical protein
VLIVSVFDTIAYLLDRNKCLSSPRMLFFLINGCIKGPFQINGTVREHLRVEPFYSVLYYFETKVVRGYLLAVCERVWT